MENLVSSLKICLGKMVTLRWFWIQHFIPELRLDRQVELADQDSARVLCAVISSKANGKKLQVVDKAIQRLMGMVKSVKHGQVEDDVFMRMWLLDNISWEPSSLLKRRRRSGKVGGRVMEYLLQEAFRCQVRGPGGDKIPIC